MTDIDLHDILSRASDGQDAPEVVHRALVTAKQRLARRRIGFGIAVAAVTVAGVVLVPRIDTSTPDPVTEPMSPPSPSATVDAPGIAPATQVVWDPDTIKSWRLTRLPELIDLGNARGPAPQEQPMTGILAALRDDNSLRLLDVDGTWRTVSLAADQGTSFGVDDIERPSISADGSRVAVATEAGIRVIDATTGTEDTIAWPDAFAPPWDNPPNVEWQPEDEGFVVFNTVESWIVGLDGTSKKAPYRSYALAIDPQGPVYENAVESRTLLTWNGEQVVDELPFVQCERMVAGYGMVACTTGSLQPSRSGPVVVNPTTGEIIAYAPIDDPDAIFSDNGGLTLLGFLDEETVLMAVGPATFNAGEPNEHRFLVVSWRFGTGQFHTLSAGDTDIRAIAVAPALVD